MVYECPDYRTAGENSCFFNKNDTSLWVNYNITVVATNALGKNISDPVEVDVVYIGMLIYCHHKLFCRYILYCITHSLHLSPIHFSSTTSLTLCSFLYNVSFVRNFVYKYIMDVTDRCCRFYCGGVINERNVIAARPSGITVAKDKIILSFGS